tara:strand:- start:1608 stop:1835 length:228 start_codon:yes stop_codon:yes gene_type:complete
MLSGLTLTGFANSGFSGGRYGTACATLEISSDDKQIVNSFFMVDSLFFLAAFSCYCVPRPEHNHGHITTANAGLS